MVFWFVSVHPPNKSKMAKDCKVESTMPNLAIRNHQKQIAINAIRSADKGGRDAASNQIIHRKRTKLYFKALHLLYDNDKNIVMIVIIQEIVSTLFFLV